MYISVPKKITNDFLSSTYFKCVILCKISKTFLEKKFHKKLQYTLPCIHLYNCLIFSHKINMNFLLKL